MKKWFLENKIVLLLLLVTVFLAYGQTLQMYFWIDDNALIYRLQHPDSREGYWGDGITGSGPYRHIVDQFILFYPFFKTNPMPYYAVGIILYFFAAVSVFVFSNKLTKSRKISLAASLIFASGFLGSETIFGITNSWQTSRGIIMSLASLYLFIKFLKDGSRWAYVFSVVLFYLSLETVFIRAPGLIFVFIFSGLIFSELKFGLRKIAMLFLNLLPFIGIHYYIYLSNSSLASRFGILDLIRVILEEKKYYLAAIPIQDLGNLFIPNNLTDKLEKLNIGFFRSYNSLYYFSPGEFLAGLFVLFSSIYLYVFHRKKEKDLVLILMLSLVWSIGNFVVFYLRDPYYTLPTVHRYYSYSLVGVAIFWAILFYFLAIQYKRSLLFYSFIIVVFVNLILNFNYQKDFNERRSIPAKAFFDSFNNSVPNLKPNALIYIDLENSNQLRNRYNSFFGGMLPEEANFAIYNENIVYYSIDVVNDFKHVTENIRLNKNKLADLHTLYYGLDGLVNTTEETRELLEKGKNIKIDVTDLNSDTTFLSVADVFTTKTEVQFKNNYFFGKYPTIKFDSLNKVPSLVPTELKFSLKVDPVYPSLPYKVESGARVDLDQETKLKVYKYLIDLDRFRRTASASSGSVWKDQTADKLIDGDLTSSWRGNRIVWDDIYRKVTDKKEYVEVDMKNIASISGVQWVTVQKPLVPTDYKISVSNDGSSWRVVKHAAYFNTFTEGTIIKDVFEPIEARFVRMNIDKTYGNDGPEIAEFIPIKTEYTKLEQAQIDQVRLNPFYQIENVEELNAANLYIQKFANFNVGWSSNADTVEDQAKTKILPVIVDGNFHQYAVEIPPNGIFFKSLSIKGINFPAEVSIKDIQINYRKP